MQKISKLSQSLVMLVAMTSTGLAQDAVTNLVTNAGRYIRTLGPLVAMVAAGIMFLSYAFGNKDGASWAVKALVGGALCFAIGSLMRLVQSWVGFAF